MPVNRLNKAYEPNPRVVPLGNYIGFVKDNTDSQFMGRLSVFIPELGGDPGDPGAWILANYASPFAGATDPTKIVSTSQTMDGSQQSYGFWAIPPDINNEVAVFFANGDPSRCYWFACLYQTNMNNMVPGIPNNVTTEPVTPRTAAPVVEYNKSNVESVDSPRRPRFNPLADGLLLEGLFGDYERGSASTSARREAPSQVFGLLSPRGNTVHIDDNTGNEFIRLRTRSGAQVLIHETSGYVYINSKNGNSWLEISDSGVDIYTANSISMRAELDFNLRADRDINIDAGSNIHLRAGKSITLNAGTDIQGSAAGQLMLASKLNTEIGVGTNLVVSAGAAASLMVTTDYQVNVTGNLRLQSGKEMSQLAGENQIRAGKKIYDNCNGAPAAVAAAATSDTNAGPSGLMVNDAKQTFASPTNDQTVWKAAGKQVNTIVGRMPTHEPWREHPNSDVPPPPTVDVEIDYQPTYGNGSSSQTLPDGSLNDDGCVPGTATTVVTTSTATQSTQTTTGATGTMTVTTMTPNGLTTDTTSTTTSKTTYTKGAPGASGVSSEVYAAIVNASSKTGAELSIMMAFADIESGFRPGIGSKSSSATGLYQFIASTWHAMVTKYGARYNVGYTQINDPVGNALMGGQFLQDNAAILKKRGFPATAGNLYIVHFMGSGGGPALLQAAQTNPGGDASSSFPSAASANPSIFRGRTNAQTVAFLQQKADSKAAAYGGSGAPMTPGTPDPAGNTQYGLPPPCDRATAGSPAIPLAKQPDGITPVVPKPETTATPVTGDAATILASLHPNHGGWIGTTRQCVSLVQATGLPHTSKWTKGSTDPTSWSSGQPIAVFDSDGKYGNHSNGSSHAAIFVQIVQPPPGTPTRFTTKPAIQVVDQWATQPAHIRTIQNNPGKGIVDNAANYAAINLL